MYTREWPGVIGTRVSSGLCKRSLSNCSRPGRTSGVQAHAPMSISTSKQGTYRTSARRKVYFVGQLEMLCPDRLQSGSRATHRMVKSFAGSYWIVTQHIGVPRLVWQGYATASTSKQRVPPDSHLVSAPQAPSASSDTGRAASERASFISHVSRAWRHAPQSMHQLAQAARSGTFITVASIQAQNAWLRFGSMIISIGCAAGAYALWRAGEAVTAVIVDVRNNRTLLTTTVWSSSHQSLREKARRYQTC
jgi:hypothetical protein